MIRRSIAALFGGTAVLASIGLSGCENTTPTFETVMTPDGQAAPLTVTGARETRVLYADGKHADCVFAPTTGNAALAALLLPALIDAGLTTVKNAITAAGGTASAPLQGYLNLPAGSPAPVCVSVISGNFLLGADSTSDAVTPPNWFNAYTGVSHAGQWKYLSKMLSDQGVHLGRTDSDAPDFYFEARVASYVPPASQSAPPPAADPPSGQKADVKPSLYFKLVPTFIAYHRPAEDIRTVFRPNAVADLNISIGLTSGDASSKATATIDMGYIASGQEFRLNYDRMSCAANATTADPCKVGPFLKESPWVPITMPANQPFVLTASVVETRTASRFVSFVGTAFGGAQSSLSTAAQDTLIPSKDRTDRAATLEANAKIGAAYASALKQTAADLLVCDNAYHTPKPAGQVDADAWSINQKQTLEVAQYDEVNLNGTAIAANMPAPFATIVQTSDQCHNDYTKLAD